MQSLLVSRVVVATVAAATNLKHTPLQFRTTQTPKGYFILKQKEGRRKREGETCPLLLFLSVVFVVVIFHATTEVHDGNGIDTAVTERWAFNTGGSGDSSPAVSQDGKTVFIGSGDLFSQDLNMYAIGATKAFKIGESLFPKSPAVSQDGKTVFVSSADNYTSPPLTRPAGSSAGRSRPGGVPSIRLLR